MIYKLRGENNLNDPIATVLKNRNITEELFLIDESVVEDYNNYNNIQQGIDLLMKHINQNSKIAIVVDDDADGFTSSAILYRYLKEVFNYENLWFKVHRKKQHGLSDDIVIEDDISLIILPDASSNDYEQHKKHKENGIDILVLDHHECEYESKDAVVINNQLSQNVKNKRLSGAGVTYKFLEALDEYLFDDISDTYLDLVALGNIADVMNLSEEETRYLCYKGLEKVNNPFIKALIETNSFQLENKYNINKLGWVIAPKLNGMIRSGSYEDKEDMFKAFVSDNYEFCLKIANKCKTAKDNQDSAVKTALGKIEKLVNLEKGDKCLILNVSGMVDYSHTGLVANKLQEKYGVPTLLYREKNDDELVRGSGRGNINISDNFKRDLLDSELFEMCEGHGNSFGFQININNINLLKGYLNNLYKDKEVILGKTYEVDLILNEETLNKNLISVLAEYEDEWGNGVPEPLIVFENIMVNIDDSNIKGKRSKNLIFECNNVKFVKKFLTNELKNSLLNQGFMFITFIGKCVNNIYNGTSTPEVEIVDIDVL